MREQIGSINGEPIERYDVCQVSDDGGITWLDFATIRESAEADIAISMVENRGGLFGHRKADYRIKRSKDGKVICSKMTSLSYRLSGLLWACESGDWPDGVGLKLAEVEEWASELANSCRSPREINEILDKIGITNDTFRTHVHSLIEATERKRV